MMCIGVKALMRRCVWRLETWNTFSADKTDAPFISKIRTTRGAGEGDNVANISDTG